MKRVRKLAAPAAATSIAQTLQAHAVRQPGAVPVQITHSTALHFELDVLREAPIYENEEPQSIEDSSWHIVANQTQLPHEIDVGDSYLSQGFEVKVARHFVCFGRDERKWEFNVVLDAGDLRTLFVGMDALRQRMQAAGFDV